MPDTTETPARIVLLGTHGQYNIGDELLLATFLHQLGDQHDYVVNSYDAADTAARVDPRYRLALIDTAGDRRALLRHLRRADAVVFAGGSILKELSAATGRNRYATLLMILAVVTFARWVARAPIAMLNIGVGPVRTPTGGRLVRMILAQVGLVTVRDAASASLCRSVGVRREVVSSTDAVFSVTPEWLLGRTPTRDAHEQSAPLRIGLSLNHDIEVPENWEHVVVTLAAAFRTIAADRPLEIHGLPMQSRGKTHDDATVLRDFAARNPEIVFVEHLPTNHAEVAAIIDSCDLVVAERLHAIITCAQLSVPVVPLAYDVKVRQVATSLGLDAVSIDLSVPLHADEVRRSIEAVADDREGARRRLAARTAELHEQSSASFDLARGWLAEQSR